MERRWQLGKNDELTKAMKKEFDETLRMKDVGVLKHRTFRKKKKTAV